MKLLLFPLCRKPLSSFYLHDLLYGNSETVPGSVQIWLSLAIPDQHEVGSFNLEIAFSTLIFFLKKTFSSLTSQVHIVSVFSPDAPQLLS